MPSRHEVRVAGLSEPLSHYTDAVRYGSLVFISGCAPLDEKGELVGGDDVVAQTEQVFQNMDRVLKATGATFADIVKVTIFLTDIRDRGAVNEVRKRYFETARPASTLVGVNELVVPGMKVEVEAVVGLSDSSGESNGDN